MARISARISADDEATLKEVAALMDADTNTVIRRALSEGLTELRIQHAIEQYQSGAVSTNQAARIAGVSIGEWLEIAHTRNLTVQVSPDELDAEVETARDI